MCILASVKYLMLKIWFLVFRWGVGHVLRGSQPTPSPMTSSHAFWCTIWRLELCCTREMMSSHAFWCCTIWRLVLCCTRVMTSVNGPQAKHRSCWNVWFNVCCSWICYVMVLGRVYCWVGYIIITSYFSRLVRILKLYFLLWFFISHMNV